MIEVSSDQSRSQFIILYAYTMLLLPLLLLSVLLFLFLLRTHRVRFHRVPASHRFYAVRCCSTYVHVFVNTCLLLCNVLYCCCCSCCCLLPLFVIVCRMVQFVSVGHCI